MVLIKKKSYNNFLYQKKINLSVYFLFIFSLMPFFSFYPVNTDVQPLFILIAIFIVITRFETILKFTLFDLFFLFIAILSFTYSFEYFSIRKSFNLIIAFVIYLIYKKYIHFLTDRILYIIILINFFAVLVHYLFPNFFIDTLGHFVREVKITNPEEGARGASGFAAEPGFMGALSVVYIMISFYLKDYKKQKKYFKKNILLSLIILFLTKSGTGFLLGVVFFIIYFFKKIFNIKNLLYILLFSIFVVYFLNSKLYSGRGLEVLKLLFTDPSVLFFDDSSVGQRVINILVGLLAPIYFPFGIIDGDPYVIAYNTISGKYLIFDYIKGHTSNISYFSWYSSQLGVFFVMLIIGLVFRAFKNELSMKKMAFVVVALLIMSSSFSIIFPPIWILFAILHTVKTWK